jgi:hypothetical protein
VNTRPTTALADLPCLLNPVQSADLTTILELTPYPRRIAVALAFVGLSRREWIGAARFPRTISSMETNMSRWSASAMIPFEAAARFAHVFGVSPELLFAAQLVRES